MLNEEQKKAIESNDSSLLIVAGAGTGKTRVLTEKIIFLLKQDVNEKEILALTFTNKAADEMLDRVKNKVHTTVMPFIGTFHSFCVVLLREFYESAGVKKNFNIFDRDETKKIIKRCLKKENITDITPRVMQSEISKLKTGLLTDITEINSEITEKILNLYKLEMEEENALDFDDLILKTVSLLRKDIKTRINIQQRYKYILIDEFQDTDLLQNDLIRLLKGEETKVIAVGDTDQTIYSWRGASVHNMLTFEETYAPAKTVFLLKNYRSTNKILKAANEVIDKNNFRQKKDLLSTREEGEDINIYYVDDEEKEGEEIANKINELHREGVEYKDIAIIYRANFQSRAIERHMLLNKIPYTVLGTRFFDRAEIKGLISYLSLILNPQSKVHFLRAITIPKRGIGARSIEKILSGEELALSSTLRDRLNRFRGDISYLQNFLSKNNLLETIKEIVRLIDYRTYIKNTFDNPEDRMREVNELISFSNRFTNMDGEEGLNKLLSEVALGSEQDGLRTSPKDSVKLMTIHAAKGLEFSNIFISGMEEGLFPFSNDEFTKHDEEEERRLCYVALTRAKNNLFCFCAKRRGFFGSFKNCNPSSFLFDIPKEITKEINLVDKTGEEDIEW